MNAKKSEGIPNELARELSAWVNSWVPVWDKKKKTKESGAAPESTEKSDKEMSAKSRH